MKKPYFYTIGFALAGLVVILVSSIWYTTHNNPSEYFSYLGISLILFALAGLTETLKRVIGKQRDLEKNQVELQRWATEQERKNESSE